MDNQKISKKEEIRLREVEKLVKEKKYLKKINKILKKADIQEKERLESINSYIKIIYLGCDIIKNIIKENKSNKFCNIKELIEQKKSIEKILDENCYVPRDKELYDLLDKAQEVINDAIDKEELFKEAYTITGEYMNINKLTEEFNELVSSLEYDIRVHNRTMEYEPFFFHADLCTGNYSLRSFIEENPRIQNLVTDEVQKLLDTAEKIELDYDTLKNKYIKEITEEN